MIPICGMNPTAWDGNEICFQTAWTAPHPIIEKLSEMYPEVAIRHMWANEDLWQDCGSRTYGIYADLVRRVDCLLTFFNDWSFYHIHDADLDERSPTADYVRLIVARE